VGVLHTHPSHISYWGILCGLAAIAALLLYDVTGGTVRRFLLGTLACVFFGYTILWLDEWLFLSRFFPNTLGDSICRAVKSRPADPIKLADVAAFDWDKVYILGPYTNSQDTTKLLGFEWKGVHRTGIVHSDGFEVLVFVKSGQVVEWLRHPRGCGDFEYSKERKQNFVLSRNEALFSVSEEDYGGPWLVVRPVKSEP
jgi:hypothetical protein